MPVRLLIKVRFLMFGNLERTELSDCPDKDNPLDAELGRVLRKVGEVGDDGRDT